MSIQFELFQKVPRELSASGHRRQPWLVMEANMEAAQHHRGPTAWASAAAAAQTPVVEQVTIQKPADRGPGDQVSRSMSYVLEVCHQTLQSTGEKHEDRIKYNQQVLYGSYKQLDRITISLARVMSSKSCDQYDEMERAQPSSS
ncbi:unnamed protein product [Prorocentrum cordatum]|uniref:Uncharacterized protein n=1 Tax=Prorocentrum cordatum TaxID=2364126 RepID=A0ABN9RE01_9DINO|nr:unnamed protein product [Polarella glacialis]